MRVVLVGSPADRDRLRADLAEAGIEVVAEVATLAAARNRGLTDALLLAPRASTAADPDALAIESGDDPPREALTPRELEVLDLVALGLPNKAIAERLAISDQTVKFHVAAIIAKLGASNRTDAVRRALRRGLVVV